MDEFWQHQLFNAAVTAITLYFGIRRFSIPVTGKIEPKNFYKTFAHLWVGFLAGLAVQDPRYWAFVVIITAVEVIAFLGRRAPKE